MLDQSDRVVVAEAYLFDDGLTECLTHIGLRQLLAAGIAVRRSSIEGGWISRLARWGRGSEADDCLGQG